VPLPTYPFQRKRYWLNASSGAGDPGAMGQAAAEHPLLGATIEDPEGGIALTGRISLRSHPWLADHAVAGTALLPGTAFVELALRAGQEAGCELLEELTLQAPLLLPETAGVALRVSLSPAGEQAGREVSIHSRLEGSAEEEPGEWVLHAQGLLLEGAPEPLEPLGAWPPEGAEPIELDSLYERLAEAGLEYGPAFQGLSAAWSLGEEIYAEVSLAEEQVGEASRFGVHPALLDAAFHATLDIAFAENEGKAMLPFAWQGVSLLGSAGAALRVKLGLGERQIGFLAFSTDGEPLLAVASVTARDLDPARLRQADRAKDLFVIEWSPLPAGEQAPGPEQAPSRLLSAAELGFEPCADSAAEALAATQAALALIQGRLADEEHAEERLVLLTEGAVATSEQESPDLTGASLWGLWRSARSEHPDRFALIDTDGSEASAEALKSALARGAEEPEVALREGSLLVPRFAAMKQAQDEPTAPAIDPDSTVLITGGLSGIGALIARHLASRHGQGHLLLVGRRGMQSEGAAELVKELQAAGATVAVRACDVSDRGRLEELLASVDPEHPLGAIVHSAGVLEDGTIESLDAERLQRVFEPKASGAWHLHELSGEAGVSRFVAFSSIAGALGGAGQGNYAAANAFLDALAQRRRAEGLPAASIAWGRLQSGMGAALSDADLARMERLGIGALSDSEVAELFDVALGGERAHLLPVRINRPALRAHAAQGVLPSIFSGLIRTPARRRGQAGSLAKRLAATPEADRQALVLDLVLSHTAAILGHASGAEVDPERAFRELGFDSLAAVELRNGLSSATGMRIAPTIVFDYPSPAALAEQLLSTALPEGRGGAAELESGEREVREALASIPLARLRSAGLLDGLLRLAQGEDTTTEDPEAAAGLIDEMDVEELIRESVDSAEAEHNERQAE
jgi:acyl transferase domain-containing protein/acyl carrier protein